MRRWLSAGGASEQETFEILVAAGEACSNAIQHAGAGSATFEVDAHLDGEVRIVVRDHGTWREARPTLGGRGLPIMDQFMDDVDFRKTDDGTEVVLRRRLT
jgi:anti-sigma regulatory factor (Ser/Thr protein kinase)